SGIARAVEDVVVDAQALRIVGLDAKQRESVLGDQVFKQSMLELKELTRSVGSLPQRYNARVANELAQALQVGKAGPGLARIERNGAGADPIQNRFHELVRQPSS